MSSGLKILSLIGLFFAAGIPVFTIGWWEMGQASSISHHETFMTAQTVEIEELKRNQAQLQKIHIEQKARDEEKEKSNKVLCRIGKLPAEWCRVQGFPTEE
jgi:hypothetical protein